MHFGFSNRCHEVAALKEEKVKKIPKNKKSKKRGDGEKLQEYSDSIVNF